MNFEKYIPFLDFIGTQEPLEGKWVRASFEDIVCFYGNGETMTLPLEVVQGISIKPFLYTSPGGNKFPAFRTRITIESYFLPGEFSFTSCAK